MTFVIFSEEYLLAYSFSFPFLFYSHLSLKSNPVLQESSQARPPVPVKSLNLSLSVSRISATVHLGFQCCLSIIEFPCMLSPISSSMV